MPGPLDQGTRLFDVSARPAVVLDCGSGYTKLGFSGNIEPTFVLPTVVATPEASGRAPAAPLADLEYAIGEEALCKSRTSSLTYPIRYGMVEDWEQMERFWLRSFSDYLRIDTEDHNLVLTEPPMNTPENRELAAEILFETFGVPGLYIGVQAVLALYASFAAAEKTGTAKQRLTGTVVDSGDGGTHVIPVSDGYVIASSIRSLPLAGRDVTRFVQQLMRERGEPVPPDMSLDVARQVKEQHSYLASDIVKEFERHDAQPEKFVKRFAGVDAKTGARFECDVAHERFLGPEIFFSPSMCSPQHTRGLPQMIDDVIHSCPIDTRRALYGNVVLSGGSTMFRDFGRRVQRDVGRLLAARLPAAAARPDVRVVSHRMQRNAAWSGGSLLASVPEFERACRTRAEYEEHGPAICRTNAVFREL